MIQSDLLAALSLAWLACASAALFLRMRGGKPTGGVLFAWLISLFMINGLPGIVFSIDGDWNPALATLERGMAQAAVSMLGVLTGVAVAEAWRSRLAGHRAVREDEAERELGEAGPVRLVLVGLASLAALQVLPRFATLTAILVGGPTLLPVGLGLLASARSKGRERSPAVPLLGIAVLPVVTSVLQGFLGYGISMLAIGGSIAVATSRRRGRAAILFFAAGYFALSFFVSYTERRGTLREAVWGGASIGQRIDRFLDIVSAMRPFSVVSERDRLAVDVRLNQLSFVGMADMNLSIGAVDYARGDTVRDAVFALVPRALWPDKPFVAGSGNLITRYTGFDIVEGTSVGVTQLLESYVNFGTWGVFFFFGVAGFLVARADDLGGAALRRGDLDSFLMVSLPACALMAVGGSFVELSVNATVGLGIAWLLKRSGILKGSQDEARVGGAETEDGASRGATC